MTARRDEAVTREVGTGRIYRSPQRDKLTERIAWALCWDFSVGKATTPHKLFMAQTEGCKERFRVHADEIRDCLKTAGLTVSLKPKARKEGK